MELQSTSSRYNSLGSVIVSPDWWGVDNGSLAMIRVPFWNPLGSPSLGDDCHYRSYCLNILQLYVESYNLPMRLSFHGLRCVLALRMIYGTYGSLHPSLTLPRLKAHR